jgi:uncharacterized protein
MGDIRVQVCYARPDTQLLRDLNMRAGATVQAAIEQSGLLQDAPEIDLALFRVGVYGKLKSLDSAVCEHDRIEIYRPLIADPKESRRRRAVLNKDDQKKR